VRSISCRKKPRSHGASSRSRATLVIPDVEHLHRNAIADAVLLTDGHVVFDCMHARLSRPMEPVDGVVRCWASPMDFLAQEFLTSLGRHPEHTAPSGQADDQPVACPYSVFAAKFDDLGLSK